jgi:hypothetical protein
MAVVHMAVEDIAGIGLGVDIGLGEDNLVEGDSPAVAAGYTDIGIVVGGTAAVPEEADTTVSHKGAGCMSEDIDRVEGYHSHVEVL